MQMSERKMATIALITVLTISMALVTLASTVNAANQIPTYLFVRAEPNPVGVGQHIYINCFLSKPTATAGMFGTGDVYTGLTVVVTAPDGTKTTMGPYAADATGGVGGLSFVPTQLGNYTFQGFYPGQTLKSGTTYNGTIELPSESTIDTVTVQQEQIPTYSSPPLPTQYWSRPIYATNYAWGSIGGSWFGLSVPSFATTGGYDATGNFNPYTLGPNSAHIMWTKPTAFGGQAGLPIPSDQESQYVSSTIISNFFEPMIISGVLIYSDYPILNSNAASWNAVDLRTGQTLWSELPGTQATIPGASVSEKIRMGQTVKFHSMQEYGSFSLFYSTGGSNSSFKLYEPFTGEYVGNITNTIGSSYIIDTDATHENPGTILGYYISQGNLTMWNSTLCFNNGVKTVEMMRPPTSVNYTKGAQWNVTVPTTLNGLTISPSLSISRVTPETILLRSSPNIVTQSSAGYAVEAGFDALTGAQLWITNRTIPMYQSLSILSARNGIYVMHNQDTNEISAFNLRTGAQMWGPVKLVGNALSTLMRSVEIAYGKVFVFDFGGFVNALDQQTGQILWTYTPPSEGYDSPYGIAPIWSFGTPSVADGKLFLSASHMYDPPMFPGAKRLVINATDGSLVWSIMSFDGRCPGAIADGFLVTWNSFDKQIYTYGKGQSAITASIRNDVLAEGGSVLITGRVTDESPGTKQSTQIANFPEGVPAVSDSSMTNFMEYVYMQQPKPTDTVGVPVTLSVVDANGNFREIGKATTDPSGFYSYQWNPDIPGKYTVFASFGGSESYWPSNTETAFAVTPAAPTPTSVPVQAQPPTEMYIAAAAVAIIIAIAIVGVLLGIMLRRAAIRKSP